MWFARFAWFAWFANKTDPIIWRKTGDKTSFNVPKAIQDFNEGFKEVKVGF